MVPGADGTGCAPGGTSSRRTPPRRPRFAHSLDRLAPLLLNHANRGELWAEYGITAERVVALNDYIAEGAPDLWTAARTLLEDAIDQRLARTGGEPKWRLIPNRASPGGARTTGSTARRFLLGWLQ